MRLSKVVLSLLCGALPAQLLLADSYDDLWMESYNITQCSCSSANASVKLGTSTAAYGVLNDWRIGSGLPDFVQPGEATIGAIGLLYGYKRLTGAARSTAELDTKAKAALKFFCQNWLRNVSNQVGSGYPATITYTSAGAVSTKGAADARVTAEVLILMRKYCLYSPNGDGATYQSDMYTRAHAMADFVNANLNTWTIDRSYAVAAFNSFAHWASAVGDSTTATYYYNQASIVSGWLAYAQDNGTFKNYFAYLDGGGKGVYNGGIDQTGFAPYEFSARPAGEAFAKSLGDWWNHGQAYSSIYVSAQSGTYVGGVHQWIPTTGTNTKLYPGSALQIADALWKIANATGNYNNFYNEAWIHYNFAKTGSGCWVNNWTVDPGYIGGFIDWVDTSNGSRPASWQRFVDTSAYFIIATEELAFSSEVNFGN